MTAHEQTLLESILDNTSYVRGRVDDLAGQVADLRVRVEYRVTKIEVRTGVLAALVSAAVSLAAVLTR